MVDFRALLGIFPGADAFLIQCEEAVNFPVHCLLSVFLVFDGSVGHLHLLPQGILPAGEHSLRGLLQRITILNLVVFFGFEIDAKQLDIIHDFFVKHLHLIHDQDLANGRVERLLLLDLE